MGLILENFKMALSSIKANKMRSFLTMLGIIIGIASVITITSVGESTKATMNKFISGFGKNRVALYVNYEEENQIDDNKYFTLEDVDYIKGKFKNQLAYISLSNGSVSTIKRGIKEQKVNFSGVDYNYIKELSTYKIIYGRDFQENDVIGRKKVTIVNREFAQVLFGKEDIVGEEITGTIDGETTTLKIIGVYNKEKTIFDSIGGGNQTDAYIPYTIAGSSTGYLDMKIAENLNSATESNKIKEFVTRYKQADPSTYKIQTLEEQAGMINQMLTMLSLGLGAIAAISLVVGGIGIMNIMLVSVTERTKEIGIRKSLGARKKDILLQFLIESIILSGAGGIIGTLIGLGLSNIATKFMNVDSTISVNAIITAVVFSFGVGIFFGLFPANKASNLDPIDALRYE